MGAESPINEASVSQWMAKFVGAREPVTFSLIAGGRSNLTFRAQDAAGTAYALRRPPLSHVLPTAHDMSREFRILRALSPRGLPVPRPLALCEEPDVTGAPFYLMEFVDGVIVRTREQAEATFDEPTRAGIGPHLAQTLADLHDVDVEEAGLGDLARHDGYIERQLRRWLSQYEQTRVPGDGGDGLVEAVGERLTRTIPRAQRLSVVHGDYRLDNTVLASDGSVRAILDWEICTLGDPLADVGLLLDYWAEPEDPMVALLGSAPTTAPGFSRREDVLAAYGAGCDLDLSEVAYYRAFGYWKLACILQGVYARYRAGATAGDAGSVDEFPAHVRALATMASEMLEG